MDVVALTQRVRDLTGFRLTSLVNSTRILDALNEAYEQLAGTEPWSWLMEQAYVNGLDGTSLYAVGIPSTQIMGVKAYTDGSDVRTLERLTRNSEEFLRTAAAGKPLSYAAQSTNSVLIWPFQSLTGTTLVVEVKVPITPLVATTDTPVFASDYHVILAYGAAARLLVEENDDTDRAMRYAAEFMEMAERMKMRERSEGSKGFVLGSTPRVRGRRYLNGGL